jgi:hypothetical protein
MNETPTGDPNLIGMAAAVGGKPNFGPEAVAKSADDTLSLAIGRTQSAIAVIDRIADLTNQLAECVCGLPPIETTKLPPAKSLLESACNNGEVQLENLELLEQQIERIGKQLLG